jgi:SAM-dependent methyltransferase
MSVRNPIESLDFWKERIERAKREHRNFAVYLTRPEKWKKIEALHASILKSTVSGRVLDAGCGYGRISGLIDDYTGVDFSPDFIEWAKELNPGKTFMVADLKDLPFKDKEFDWAVASSIKEMVVDQGAPGDWDKMAAELKRVAKKVLILKYVDAHEYEIL